MGKRGEIQKNNGLCKHILNTQSVIIMIIRIYVVFKNMYLLRYFLPFIVTQSSVASDVVKLSLFCSCTRT